MTTKIHWKKKMFSSKYELFSEDKKIGELDEGNLFSKSAIGKLDGKQLKFEKVGLFKSETSIIDLDGNKKIGQIIFNSWANKAEILIEDKTFGWQYESFWGKKWNISENGEAFVKYNSATLKGEIESKVHNEVLLLSGLFIFNYYVQTMIIIVISTTIIISAN